MFLQRAVLAAFPLVLVACVTVPEEAGFPDVRERVETRLSKKVRWNRGGPEDAAVGRWLAELLAGTLTADTAVQVALLRNRRLQAVYEDLGVAQAELVQAGLFKNPVLASSVTFPVSGGPTELAFSVVQDFLGLFVIPLRKRVAEAEFESAKLHVTGAIMDLAASTQAAFYRAQADEQLLEMRQQIAAATEASYEAAKRLHEAGNIRDLDLANERTLHGQARLELAAQEAVAAQSRERLNVFMGLWGREAQQWTMAKRLPDIPDQPVSLESLEKRAISASLDLATVRQDMESIARKAGLLKTLGWLPFLDVGAEAEREEGEWEVGPAVALAIPVFDQGQARVAAVESELRRLQEIYHATAVEIRAAARAMRSRLLAARRMALFYRDELLPLSEEIVRETQLQYNAMQIGVFQLLLAKRQQIETGGRFVEMLYEYWEARSGLEQILRGRVKFGDGDLAEAIGSSGFEFPGMDEE